jgi:hypothetical protein
MGGSTVRYVGAAVLLAALVALAGCGGGGGSETPTPGPDYPDSREYNFSEGEMYSYEVAENGNVTSRLSMQVASVNESHIAVNVLLESVDGGETGSQVVTERGELLSTLGDSEVTAYLRYANVINAVTSLDNYRASRGVMMRPSKINQIPWNMQAITVGNETTVGGVTCRHVALTPEVGSSAPDVTACVKPNWPFAVGLSVRSDDGSTAIQLQGYNRESSS